MTNKKSNIEIESNNRHNPIEVCKYPDCIKEATHGSRPSNYLCTGYTPNEYCMEHWNLKNFILGLMEENK